MIPLLLMFSLLRPQAGTGGLEQILIKEGMIFVILKQEIEGVEILLEMIRLERVGVPNWVKDKPSRIADHLDVMEKTIHSCKNQDLKMFLEDSIILKIVPFYGYLLRNGQASGRVDETFEALKKAVELCQKKWENQSTPFVWDELEYRPKNINFGRAA